MISKKVLKLSGCVMLAGCLLLAGCQTSNTGEETNLPDSTTPVSTNMPTPTKTPEMTPTNVPTNAPTHTPVPTSTPTPSPTESPLTETPKEAFKYVVENNEVTISGLRNESLTRIFIPGTIDGYPVTQIATTAFYLNENLTEVVLSENLRVIGMGAFAGCINLKEITFPSTLTEISDQAFYYSGICRADLPEGLVSIGEEAFAYCYELKDIALPDSIEEIGAQALMGSAIEKVVLPKKLTVINHLFRDCEQLQSVYIPENVEQIGNASFWNCSSLKELIVSKDNKKYTSRDENGNECNVIVENYYRGLRLLHGCATSVIPEGVEIIAEGAFYGCKGLTRIEIPKSVVEFEIADGLIEAGAFQGCVNLEEIVVDKDNSVYTSRDYSGKECNVIIHMNEECLIYGCINSVIPDGVTEIETKAFYGTGIEKIYIPKTIEYIGRNAFSGCPYLEEIVVDKENMRYFSVDEKGQECNAIFNDDGELEQGCINTRIPTGDYREYFEEKFDIELEPEEVYCIGVIRREAFAEVEIESLVIPSNIYSIQSSAFSQCRKLKTIVLENGVTYIEESAFMDCTDLTTVVLPETIKWLGDFAFTGCSSLKEITMPASIGGISNRAFWGCEDLIVYTTSGSYADLWAQGNGFQVIYK